MKFYFILILFAILTSCKPKEKEYTQNDDFSKMGIENNNNNIFLGEDDLFINNYSDELIDIEFDITGIKLVRLDDDDVRQGEIVNYKIENNLIDSVNEIEYNQKIIEILDEPFENLKLSLFSEYSEKRLFNGIKELLNIFSINPSQSINEKFNNFGLYKGIRIIIKNLTLYVYKEYDTGYKLFFIEYDKDIPYEPRIKIEYTKDEIINLLGNPSAYSDERNLFIYNSNKTLRQINILFENDKVKNIQLISWGGI
jgi:hypothetical protein